MALPSIEFIKSIKKLSQIHKELLEWASNLLVNLHESTTICRGMQGKQYLMNIFYHASKMKKGTLKVLRVWAIMNKFLKILRTNCGF